MFVSESLVLTAMTVSSDTVLVSIEIGRNVNTDTELPLVLRRRSDNICVILHSGSVCAVDTIHKC